MSEKKVPLKIWYSTIINLISGFAKSSGRSRGKLTVPYRGGGNRRLYRFVDFKRTIALSYVGFVRCYEYDPNRSAHLALVIYTNGFISYYLACENMDIKVDGRKFTVGGTLNIKQIPRGSILYNIEILPNHGGKMVRAAGGGALLLKKSYHNYDYALIKFKSGEHRLIHENCIASLGIVSNLKHFLKKKTKAGDSRHEGIRPRTRAYAKNPIDHPMGGRTKGGKPQRSPNGQLTLNVSTRTNKKSRSFIIIGARKSKLSKKKAF